MRSAAGSASGIPRRSVSAHLVAVGLRPSFPLCSLGLRAMASKLAQTVASSAGARSHVRDFYLEVCRCIPFIQRLHKLEEIASLRELRAAVKGKFNEFKDAKDPRVVDLLIFKGREELECYLLMHKQRHHAITEYIEPYSQRAQRALDAKSQQGSAFLDTFFNTQYPQITQKL